MKQSKFWNIWDKAGVVFILAFMIIVFGLIDPQIIAPKQLLTALTRSAVTGIAAAGMVFAICAGGFDLSVGAIMSLVGCVVAKLIVDSGMNTWLAILVGIGVAAVCGVVNGIIITKFKIQTFVATLATQLMFAGVALKYSDGYATQLTSKVNGSLKLLSTGSIAGIPMQLILVVIVYLVAYVLYQYLPFGTKVRAIGSNETAARISGIKADRTLIMVFVMTAVTAGMAAVLNVARLSTGNPTAGTGYELDAITAVILGGTAMSGGKGNIWGTLMGAVLVTFVKMGLNMLNVGEAMQKMSIALVLLIALSISGLKIILQKEAEA
ncbi:MAG: ABC transporter permease [Ruthenibacterium sp.]